MPIPPLYFFEVDYNQFEVMDGQQRLNALNEFYNNNFCLTDLGILVGMKGQYYKNFSERVARAFDRTSISAIIVLTENEAKFDSEIDISNYDIRRIIFHRLNTGGRKLNPQEIRNAINPGYFNELIVNLTKYPKFTEVFGIPPYTGSHLNHYDNEERIKNNTYYTMKDCEYVLRYFALKDLNNVYGSLKAMLDRAMQTRATLIEKKINLFFTSRTLFFVV